MAKGGAFEGLDVAVNFHPNKINEATVGVSTAVNSAKFHFTARRPMRPMHLKTEEALWTLWS